MLQYSNIKSVFEFVKICGINFVFLFLFIFLGKRMYLKNILKNNNYYIKKNNKIVNYEKICKKTNKGRDYIKKEFKILFKTPAYFLQCIFPIFILLFSIIIVMFTTLPSIKAFFESEVIRNIYTFKIDVLVVCVILSAIQILFTLSNISITGVSREGSNAKIMKIIPVGLYKQFIYKSVPQIIINTGIIVILLTFVKLLMPIINFCDLFIIMFISLLINIINSELMLLVDFVKPNLNWNSQYEAIKQNNNKLFQYVFSILMLLIFKYFSKIFSNIVLKNFYTIIIVFFIIIIIIMNLLIKKYINNIVKKIN